MQYGTHEGLSQVEHACAASKSKMFRPFFFAKSAVTVTIHLDML